MGLFKKFSLWKKSTKKDIQPIEEINCDEIFNMINDICQPLEDINNVEIKDIDRSGTKLSDIIFSFRLYCYEGFKLYDLSMELKNIKSHLEAEDFIIDVYISDLPASMWVANIFNFDFSNLKFVKKFENILIKKSTNITRELPVVVTVKHKTFKIRSGTSHTGPR